MPAAWTSTGSMRLTRRLGQGRLEPHTILAGLLVTAPLTTWPTAVSSNPKRPSAAAATAIARATSSNLQFH